MKTRALYRGGNRSCRDSVVVAVVNPSRPDWLITYPHYFLQRHGLAPKVIDIVSL